MNLMMKAPRVPVQADHGKQTNKQTKDLLLAPNHVFYYLLTYAHYGFAFGPKPCVLLLMHILLDAVFTL